MKPIKPLYVIILVIVFAAAGFYGGMMFQKNQAQSFSLANGASGNMMYSNRGFGGGQGGMGRGLNAGMRPVGGKIISVDNNAITVQLQNGSSKIINLTGQTTIDKSVTGSVSDLKTGDRVTAFGTTNSDGSVTAQTVMIGNGVMRFREPGAQISPTASQ